MATSALDALRELQRALNTTRAEEVPEGWLTVAQWARETNKASQHVGNILREAAIKGLMECREFRIQTGQGVRSVQHYRQPQKRKGKP